MEFGLPTWGTPSARGKLGGVAALALVLSLQAAHGGDEGVIRSDAEPRTVFPRHAPAGDDVWSQERQRAAALFAQGVWLLRQAGKVDLTPAKALQRKRQALAQFQRAHQYDPRGLSILQKLVPLAFELQRPQVAARYAVRAAELHPDDAELLRQLAIYLEETGEPARAAGLYEHSLRLSEQATLTTWLTRLSLGHLYLLTDEPAASVRNFESVAAALEAPATHGLSLESSAALRKQYEGSLPAVAEAYLGVGRHDDALATYRADHRLRPHASRLAWRTAQVQAAAGQTDAALTQVEAYLTGDCREAGGEAFRLLKQLLHQRDGRCRSASAYLQRLRGMVDKQPSQALPRRALGDALLEAGDLAAAEDQFRSALRIEPSLTARQGLVEALRRRGDVPGLLKELAALAADSHSLEPLGGTWDAIVKDRPLVKRLVHLAEAEEPIRPAALYAAALLSSAVEQPRRAARQFTRVYERHALDDAAVLTVWGLAMLGADEGKLAAAAFRRALEDNIAPELNDRWHFFLARGLDAAGQTDAAAAIIGQAIALRPERLDYRLRAAYFQFRAGRHEQAATMYQQILTEASVLRLPAYVAAGNEARSQLASIAARQGNPERAEEYLRQILDEDPEDAEALNDLGYLWAKSGRRLPQALRLTRQAVAQAPGNPAYLDSLGWTLHQLGQHAEAAAWLEKALAVNGARGDNPEILEHYGEALAASGRGDEARGAWQRAERIYRAQGQTERAKHLAEKLGS